VDQRRGEDRWRFVARSPARTAALEAARIAAPASVPVLLVGPPGSGRGVLAQDLHDHSRRGGGAYVAFDCASTSPDEAERRIFGTGRRGGGSAGVDLPGCLESAEGGSLYLQEIDALSPAAQVRLERYLGSTAGMFQRVGDPAVRTARVRLIASTRRDLAAD